MHVRKLLTTAGAVVASGIIALAPTAAHAAVTTIVVDGVAAPNGNITYDGIMKSGGATFGAYSLGCTSGSVGGVVKRGTGGLDPNPAFVFSSLNLACGSGIGPATVSLTCPLGIVMSNTNTVNVGKTDTNITGVAEITNGAGTDCVRATFAFGTCKIDFGGSVAVSFDETVTTVGGVDYQQLTLSGGGATTKNATGFCLALVPNNSAVTFSVEFQLHVSGTTTGVVDFQ
jgi:hypothetical protein